jgi:hypothetical protein
LQQIVLVNILTGFSFMGFDAAMVIFRWLSIGAAVSLLALSLIIPGIAATANAAARSAVILGLGTASTPAAVALESNGNRVVAFDTRDTTPNKLEVCVVKPATTHGCWHSTRLATPSGYTNVYDYPQVLAIAPNRVVVTQAICCYFSGRQNTFALLLYTSSDGGLSFGAPAAVGTLPAGASALVHGQIVWTTGTAIAEPVTEIQSCSATGGNRGGPVTLVKALTSDSGIGQYKNGVLVAAGGPGFDPTYVEYAPAGKNLHLASSFHRVGTFAKEQFEGISGNVLLTLQDNSPGHLLIRYFNGTRFGRAHPVPGEGINGYDNFAIVTDPSGHVHVFSIDSGHNWHLRETSTATGATWTKAVDLGAFLSFGQIRGALDAHGKGLVTATDTRKIRAVQIG